MPTSKEVEAKLQMLLDSFLEACKQEDIAKSKGVLAEIRKAILLEVQCALCLSFEMCPSDESAPVTILCRASPMSRFPQTNWMFPLDLLCEVRYGRPCSVFKL